MIYCFRDRAHAGQYLAGILQAREKIIGDVILALPKGGIPVAFELARLLHLPLDILLSKKIVAPNCPDLLIGALGENDICVLNDEIINKCQIADKDIQKQIESESLKLSRCQEHYKAFRNPVDLKNKKVILVDDGIATGATIKAAIMVLREADVECITLLVPIANANTLLSLKALADEVICPFTPDPFFSIGQWYQSFTSVADEEACQLLLQAKLALKV